MDIASGLNTASSYAELERFLAVSEDTLMSASTALRVTNMETVDRTY